MMKSFVAVAATVAGAFDDDVVSLLQLRAQKHESLQDTNSSSNQPNVYNGHSFGCTGRTRAVNVVSCGLFGDVHQNKQFNGPPDNHLQSGYPNSDGEGWFWIAKSKDGDFQAQAFYRQRSHFATMSHYAFKFGDTTVFLDRESDGRNWNWKYFFNGEEKLFSDTPLELGELYWINKAAGAMANNGAQAIRNVGKSRTGAERQSCFEYKGVSLWTSFMDFEPLGPGPDKQPGFLEVEGSLDYLDKDFGQCALNQQQVDKADILVTIEQGEKVCRDDDLSAEECESHVPPDIPPTTEEMCELNGVHISHAEDLCADQRVHSIFIYEDCKYDVCASIDADAQQNAVGGAEMAAEIMNPEATCTVATDSCKPCDICSKSTSVDLSNVVQNNLGGLGPDSGAEEIRYKNAIDVDGRKVDVVLTAEGAYTTPKPAKNGYTGTGFGRFTMKTKSSTEFTFSFVDAASGEAVGVKDLALTFYDLDQAKKSQQSETISACGAAEVYTTMDTELDHTASGLCHSFKSTTRGTGKDNPSDPGELTKTQAARSVTFEFHKRASLSFSASIGGSGKTPRPILFSFKPQVACGASDAQTQCAQ